MGEVLRREDGCRGHHDELDIGNGHARLLHLPLGIFQHVDILGDAICLHVVGMHVSTEGDHVDCVKTLSVDVLEGNDVKGRYLCVEGVSILEVIVPDLLHSVTEELGSAALGCFVTGVVFEAGFVGQLCIDRNDCGGIVHDGAIVKRQTIGANKRVASMIGGIPHCVYEDGSEGVDPPKLIIGNLHEDRERHFSDQKEVVDSGFPFKGRKGILSLLEMERDCIRRHAWFRRILLGPGGGHRESQ